MDTRPATTDNVVPPRPRGLRRRFLTVLALIAALLSTGGIGLGIANAATVPAAIPLTSAQCPSLIQQGQQSGCVTRLQQLLNYNGAGLTVDGDFGPNTLAATKLYQNTHGLGVDGVVGPTTKSYLESPGAASTPTGTTAQKIVSYAQQAAAGRSMPGWNGGRIGYSWGGGHGSSPKPSKGTCSGYTGSIQPCPATKTVGLDCSGFSRWVYSLAYGSDVLGSTNTDGQKAKMTKVSSPQAGDLVFFGTSADVHHVGIYVGSGKMVNAARTGTILRTDNVSSRSDVVGYYRL